MGGIAQRKETRLSPTNLFSYCFWEAINFPLENKFNLHFFGIVTRDNTLRIVLAQDQNVQMFLFSGQCAWLHLASSQACHLNWKREIFQINIIGLKIPTGGRQTSQLFIRMTKELNKGQLRNNSSLVVRESSTLTTQPRCLFLLCMF